MHAKEQVRHKGSITLKAPAQMAIKEYCVPSVSKITSVMGHFNVQSALLPGRTLCFSLLS